MATSTSWRPVTAGFGTRWEVSCQYVDDPSPWSMRAPPVSSSGAGAPDRRRPALLLNERSINRTEGRGVAGSRRGSGGVAPVSPPVPRGSEPVVDSAAQGGDPQAYSGDGEREGGEQRHDPVVGPRPSPTRDHEQQRHLGEPRRSDVRQQPDERRGQGSRGGGIECGGH